MSHLPDSDREKRNNAAGSTRRADETFAMERFHFDDFYTLTLFALRGLLHVVRLAGPGLYIDSRPRPDLGSELKLIQMK